MASTPETFEEEVKSFQPIAAKEAMDAINNQNERKLIFLGRPTCPFCRRFLPKLKNVVEGTGDKVYYLDTTDTDRDQDISHFRLQVGAKTVPSLVYVGGESAYDNLNVDSSWSEEQIRDAIEKYK